MNTTELVVEIPYEPEFFSGLISTTTSVVFIAARIPYIRFFTAMHVYDFYISFKNSLIIHKPINLSDGR